MVIFFDDDDFEPLGQGRDDAAPGAPAGQDDGGAGPAPDTAIDLERIDNGDYLLDAGFAAEAHLGQLVDGDDDGDGNPWTSAGLENRFYEDMREHLDGAPNPETREALQGDLDRIWDRTRPEIVGREHARRLRKRAAVGEWTLARYRELAAANPALAPAALREAEDTLGRLQGLGAAQDAVDGRRKAFKAELRDAVLNGASEMDPRGALEAFKSGGYAELFDAGDREGRKAWEGHLTQAAVTRDDDDAWERERGELENQRMKGLAAVMFRAERERAIRSGDVSGAGITRAVKSGVIGREDGERLRQAALARKDELREQAARYAEIADGMMRGEAPSVQTMEWIDPWYREVMKPALELMDPQAREVVDLDIIRRAGRVPEDRIKEIRRGLNGDDPEAVIDSAGWLGRLRDEMPELAPELKAWLPRSEYDRAVAIADAIDAGYPAAKILKELPRPHIRDMLHRPDPLEGDGIELELFNEGGGEAADGPGGEAEGAESDVQTAIRRPKGVPGRSGKPKDPCGKHDDPLPLPPIPMPGGGTEERPEDTGRQIPGAPQQTGDFRRDAREFQEFLRMEKVLEPVDPDEFGQPRDVTAERANDEYAEIVKSRRPADRKNEPVEPAYQIGQPVHDFNIGDKTDLEFVRAITRNGSKSGKFMMLKQDYERILKGGGPSAVKDAWGLANEPEMVLPVNPKNTTVRVGSAAANRFGSGGGLQFEMTGELRRSWFGKPVEMGRSSD